jgi:hypothetical protein
LEKERKEVFFFEIEGDKSYKSLPTMKFENFGLLAVGVLKKRLEDIFGIFLTYVQVCQFD